jgi:hypothetical protein
VPGRDVPVGPLRGAVAHRVDDHDLRPATLRLGHERPQVQVRRDHVAGPDDDVARVHEAFRIDARGGPDRHRVGGAGAGVAVGALGDGRPELVEVRVADVEPVEYALGAQVAHRHDRLGSVLGDRRAKTAVDLVERLVPGDPLEAAAALRAGPAHRVQHPAGVVDLVLVVVDLDAQPAAGERVIGVAPHLHGLPVGHGHEHRAGVRAVVRARGPHGRGGDVGDGDVLDRGHRSIVRRPRARCLALRDGAVVAG